MYDGDVLGQDVDVLDDRVPATRAGHTFVTVGPLLDMDVEGRPPGTQMALGATGGTVAVSWRAESVRVPIRAVEVVVGGETVDVHAPADPMAARGACDVL